jgi:hypothetical protein
VDDDREIRSVEAQLVTLDGTVRRIVPFVAPVPAVVLHHQTDQVEVVDVDSLSFREVLPEDTPLGLEGLERRHGVALLVEGNVGPDGSEGQNGKSGATSRG